MSFPGLLIVQSSSSKTRAIASSPNWLRSSEPVARFKIVRCNSSLRPSGMPSPSKRSGTETHSRDERIGNKRPPSARKPGHEKSALSFEIECTPGQTKHFVTSIRCGSAPRSLPQDRCITFAPARGQLVPTFATAASPSQLPYPDPVHTQPQKLLLDDQRALHIHATPGASLVVSSPRFEAHWR